MLRRDSSRLGRAVLADQRAAQNFLASASSEFPRARPASGPPQPRRSFPVGHGRHGRADPPITETRRPTFSVALPPAGPDRTIALISLEQLSQGR